ncbi:MAG: hypothetical protein ACKPKO_55720, partial [Candidatus Fonsibacter sp.]
LMKLLYPAFHLIDYLPDSYCRYLELLEDLQHQSFHMYMHYHFDLCKKTRYEHIICVSISNCNTITKINKITKFSNRVEIRCCN